MFMILMLPVWGAAGLMAWLVCTMIGKSVQHSRPGWFRDPWQLAPYRYYEGRRWTGHTSRVHKSFSPEERLHSGDLQ
jgi:hypothetical protein